MLAAAVNSRYAGQRCIDVEELWPKDDAVASRYEECAPIRAVDVERKRMALYVNLICSGSECTSSSDSGTSHTLEASVILRRVGVLRCAEASV